MSEEEEIFNGRFDVAADEIWKAVGAFFRLQQWDGYSPRPQADSFDIRQMTQWSGVWQRMPLEIHFAMEDSRQIWLGVTRTGSPWGKRAHVLGHIDVRAVKLHSNAPVTVTIVSEWRPFSHFFQELANYLQERFTERQIKRETIVFISYRHKDSASAAGRICDWLNQHCEHWEIFVDVYKISPGDDIQQKAEGEANRCEVFLPIIGPNWLMITDEQGNRRLDNPSDLVRREIEIALRRDIPIIPVLVDHASMPKEDEPPDSLKQLANRNAIQVRPDPDFRNDMDRLVRGIEKCLQSHD